MPGENKNPAGEARATGAAGAATLKRIPDKKKVEKENIIFFSKPTT